MSLLTSRLELQQEQLQEDDDNSMPKVYTLSMIHGAIQSQSNFDSDLVTAIQDGFAWYSSGKFNACPIQTMGAPPMAPFSSFCASSNDNKEYAAQTCVKSGYITGESHYVIKVASGGYPLPNNSGLIQLYSQTTGRLEALLLDEGILTELRTAAAGAVAAQLFAPRNNPSRPYAIGMVGTGIQARYQLRFLKTLSAATRDVTTTTIFLWGRTKENVELFQKDILQEGFWKNVTIVNDPNQLLDLCDLIVTTTSSREPILTKLRSSSQRKQKGLHMTCIGADATGKIELDPLLTASADLLVADSRLQTMERGEFEETLKRKLVPMENILEIGEVVPRVHLHRRHPQEGEDTRFTIFDSSGVAVQDCVVAKIVHDTLVQQQQQPLPQT